MKRIFRQSILVRYIISYALVMAVLLIGVVIYVSSYFTDAIRSKVIDSNINRLGVLRVQHEEKFNALLSIANQISLSPYISSFKLKDEPMKAYHLKQQLSAYSAANDFCDQLYVVFDEDDYLYSANTSVSLDLFVDKMVSFENIPPDKLREAIRSQDGNLIVLPSQNMQSTLTSDTNKRMSAIIVPLRIEGKVNIGKVIFFIQDSAYQQMFSDEIDEQRSMYVFYKEQLLSSSHRLQDVPDEVVLRAVFRSESDTGYPLIQNGVKYLLFVQQSSLFDLQYAALIPDKTINLEMTRWRLRFGFFILLICIPCSLLTVYFARRHVKPIRDLQKSFLGEQSEDGFTSIRSGIETLIGQNHDLNTRLDLSLTARKEEFARNFIKGRYITREEAVAAAGGLGLKIDRAVYLVAVIASLPHDRLRLAEQKLLEARDNDVAGCGMEIVANEQELYIMFADTSEALNTWVDSVKTGITELDKDAVLAVSDIYDDFVKAGSAYLEASTAYDNRFVMGTEHVLRFADVNAEAHDLESFARSYLDGFRKALHAGDSHALNDRIDELSKTLERQRFSLFSFRIIINDIISTLLGKYFSYGGVQTDALQYYDIFTLSNCRRVSDLVDVLRRLCNVIMTREEQSLDNEPSLIQQVTSYMRQNYTNPDLSMKSIADLHGISATRLSMDYKEQTGLHPSDFLLLLRMEKAKKLLTETEMAVKDIGTAVGYYDTSVFIRRFKQHMSLTPIQYRQSMKDI